MNATTGAVTFTPNPGFAGTTTYSYQVCLAAPNALTCSIAVVTVNVGATIDAQNDNLGSFNGGDGGATASVIVNDTTNGVAAVISTNVNLTPGALSSTPAAGGISMNAATGVITVQPGTTAGTYTYAYEICTLPATAPTPTCDTAIATLVVDTPVITPQPDTADTSAGTPVTTPVLGNDTHVGGTINPGSVTVTTPSPNGTTTVDPTTGAITFTPNPGFSGTTTYTYQECLAAPNALTCGTAVVTVNVGAIDVSKALAGESGTQPGLAEAGETLTYTITVRNSGALPVTSYGLLDTLGAGLSFVSATNGGTNAGPTTTWTGLTIPANGTLAVQLVATVNRPIDSVSVRNLARGINDPDPACPSAACVEIPTAAYVTPQKLLTGEVGGIEAGLAEFGETLNYTISLVNTGGTAFSNYRFTENVPAGATLVAVSGAAGFSGPVQGPAVLSLTVPSVPARGAVNVGVSFRIADVPPAGLTEIVNLISGGDLDPACGANCRVVTPLEQPAQLSIIKTTTTREARIGDLVRYTVRVVNIGKADYVNGTIVDTPPQGFNYVAGSMTVVDRDNAFALGATQYPLNISGIDVPMGEEAIITYILRVGAGVRHGVHANQARALDRHGRTASNIGSVQVTVVADPMLDESLIMGTVFDDRDGDGWQDPASLTKVRVQGGFAPGAYIANSTEIDRGQGPKPEPDASSPMLHGISVGRVAGRQSDSDEAENHQVVIRQRLSSLDFSDDFVLTSAEGATLRMDAAGQTRIEKSGDAAKGLNGAAPQVIRTVAPTEGGYVVEYVIRNGSGTTSMGSAGRYEFVRATGVSGATVNFTPALTHSYVNAAATTSSGQKRYQVVRVPQYGSVSMSGVEAPAWNGSSGGVVVADASGTITLANGSVEGQPLRAVFAAGRGFRGGAGITASGSGTDVEWRSTSNAHGIKGEGIAGTPRRVSSKSNNFGVAVTGTTLTAVDNGVQGYPNGDYARGAPGNAGGGGTEGSASADSQRNAGGGGGGNHAAGGLGGRPWNAPLNDTNGRGGAGYASSIDFNRVLLGGGGGAGGTNNSTGDTGTYENSGISCGAAALCSSGAAGGGIVILRARTFAGSGVIDVRGGHGYNVSQDAGGGGGAGGSVVLQAREGGSATIDARGGDGGNAWAGNTGGIANRHGPGGGGGGGFVAYAPSNFSVSATLTGGRAGRTSNGPTDTYGSNGNSGGLSSFLSPTTPGVAPGADCLPDLGLAKTNGVSTLNNGDVSNYVFTVANTGGPSSGTITVVDVLPAGLTVPNGAVALTGAQAANWSCTAATNVLTCNSTTVLATGANSVFGFTAQVTSVANGSSVTNRARVGGGGDPNKATPTSTTAAACTGNNTPAGCAIDVDTVNAPLLSLVKTDNVEAVVIGGTTTYQLTLSNTGAAPTTGTIRVIDVLPVGMTYAGATPFSGADFTCTYTAGTRSFSCDRTTALANGSSATLAIPVTVEASATGALTNRAQVGGGGDPGKVTLPTVATATACPAPTSPATTNSNASTGCAADTNSLTEVNLVLQKDDGQPFMPINGQTTYQFIVRNDGTADSSGAIQFRDVLPTPMNWPTSLTLAGPNAGAWTCTRESATAVSCTSSTAIAVGSQSQFSLVANVGAATSLTQYTNRARIRGGGDTDLPATLDDAAVSACTGGNVPLGCAIDLNTAQNAAQIRLAKSHPDITGSAVTFNLLVSNSGGTASSGEIRVVDVLPGGITYSGAASFTSGGFNCTHASSVITCNSSAALATGASATITFAATISGAGGSAIVNRAQVAGGSDPQLGASTTATSTTAAQCSNNATPYLGCAIDTVVAVAALTIQKSAPGPAVAGGTLTYTLTVANAAGGVTVSNAVLRDAPGAGLDCTQAGLAAPTCAVGSGAAVCPAAGALTAAALTGGSGVPIPSLPGGSSVVVTLQCRVTASGQ